MIPFLASQSSLHQHRVGGGAASFFGSLLEDELRTFDTDSDGSRIPADRDAVWCCTGT
jgi:hypothetical protein